MKNLLTRQNGEEFIKALRGLLKNERIILCPVNRKKRKRKGKTRFERLVNRSFNTMKDGIWRASNLTDTTCTNIIQLNDTTFKLGLRIDLGNSSHLHKVKWNWNRIEWNGQKATVYNLDRKSLKRRLFPTVKRILEKMGMVTKEISCDTIGGVGKKDFYVQVVVVNPELQKRADEEWWAKRGPEIKFVPANIVEKIPA